MSSLRPQPWRRREFLAKLTGAATEVVASRDPSDCAVTVAVRHSPDSRV